jgi:hypothetical protein
VARHIASSNRSDISLLAHMAEDILIPYNVYNSGILTFSAAVLERPESVTDANHARMCNLSWDLDAKHCVTVVPDQS